MKKQTVYIFAAFIVVLLILAIVIMWLTGGIGGGSDEPEASPTPEVTTNVPRETLLVIPTETPAPTEASPTLDVTATPEPTPEQPSGTVIGSGPGVSAPAADYFEIKVQADGSVKLTISVYARSYTMQIGQRAIGISVNGAAASGMTRSLSVESSNAQTDTLIFSYTTTVEKGCVTISVDWNYKGQYSGQDLDVISSSTTASLT